MCQYNNIYKRKKVQTEDRKKKKDKGSVWIGLILLKLKTYCWNHCSKIIFKCVNSIVGPIFNEKVVKKWNLWVHEQYIMYCLRQKVNFCGYCSLNSNRVLQNAWKKKKNKRKTQTWEETWIQTYAKTKWLNKMAL